jgi:methylmalonyl-CoA mutase, N-terminal domain
VIDPLGGSWYVEWLTDEIERQCEEEFARILEMSDDGTMLSGILAGIERATSPPRSPTPPSRSRTAWTRATSSWSASTPTSTTDEDELEILRISAEVGASRRAGRRGARRTRRRGGRGALERLERRGHTDENLVPLIMDAVRAEATVGEISKALQDVWGTYHETPQL